MNTILETREQAVRDLRARGYEVLPSSANFVFAKVPGNESAARTFEKLSDAGVLVRYWSKPLLDQWLRISIGTPDEMQKLMAVLDA